MWDNFIFRTVKNSELTDQDNIRIFSLKNQYWNHPFESHLKWRLENLNDGDLHVWMEKMDGQLMAYLDLVFLEVIVDAHPQKMLGVGNVCVEKQYAGQGIGLLLMQICNHIIKNHKIPGILLCHNELIKFYSLTGWKTYDGDVFFKGKPFQEYVMFTEIPAGKTIQIERNF